MKWKSNSCWIDSLLYILLNKEIPWITRNILDVKLDDQNAINMQTELKQIYNKNRDYCVNLRKLIKVYANSYDSGTKKLNWLTDEQDPLDFIIILIRAFDIPSDVKYKITYQDGTTNISTFTFNQPFIDYELLQKNEPISIKQIMPQFDNITYLYAEFLIININRNFMNKKKLLTQVLPTETIELEECKLTLIGIIVHHGRTVKSGHYTSMVKSKDDEWCEYNDVKSELKQIGSFNKMLTKYVKENSVMLFYSK